jgi:hypothetical protein
MGNSEQGLIDRHRCRILRGRIIRALCRYYGQTPDTIAFEAVRHIADRQEFTAADVRRELAYLIECGYARSPDRKRDALDEDPFLVYGATAKGMQLIGGEISDSSIEVHLPHD